MTSRRALQDDAAGVGPLGLLLVIALTLGFEGLLLGSSIVSESFPAASTVDFGSCSNAGGLDKIACVIENAWNFVVNVVKVIFGVVALIFNLVSFNVPGAPWFVRLPIGACFGFGLLWSIASLFRGGD